MSAVTLKRTVSRIRSDITAFSERKVNASHDNVTLILLVSDFRLKTVNWFSVAMSGRATTTESADANQRSANWRTAHVVGCVAGCPIVAAPVVHWAWSLGCHDNIRCYSSYLRSCRRPAAAAEHCSPSDDYDLCFCAIARCNIAKVSPLHVTKIRTDGLGFSNIFYSSFAWLFFSVCLS